MKQYLIVFFLFISFLVNLGQTIDVTVDWNNTVRQIPITAYGVNSPANFIPLFSNDPIFMDNLEFVTQKKGLIRLHGWGMLGDSPEAWQENGVWDSNKINEALTPLVEQGYKVMINIPSGPLGEDDYQNPEEFAQFCADLVQIVNIDHGLGIEYWEIPNERESDFTNPGLTVNEMAILIQTATQSMKAIDPTIKVGGPATAWVNIEYLTQLVEATFPDIDFITCHTYSGDCSNTIDNAYDIAQNATADLAILRNQINTITGAIYLPIFLTEYNISFQGCPRVQNYEGAVNDAIIMTESIASGIDATNYWAVAPYSDMSFIDGDDHFEIAHLYEIFNQSFHGDLLESQSSNNTKIIMYATAEQDQESHAFCLINRTSETQTVNLQFENWLPTDLIWHLFDVDNEFETTTTNWANINDGNLFLTPYSVNLFVSNSTLSLSDDSNIITVYPNPTTEKTDLQNQFTNDIFQVFTITGSVVKKGVISNNSIDLSLLKTGIYFIKIKDYKTGNIKVGKIIKK